MSESVSETEVDCDPSKIKVWADEKLEVFVLVESICLKFCTAGFIGRIETWACDIDSWELEFEVPDPEASVDVGRESRRLLLCGLLAFFTLEGGS